MNLLVKSQRSGRDRVAVPRDALEYVGFSAHSLQPGEELPVLADDRELCIVLLSGSVSIRGGHARLGDFAWDELAGRASVFEDTSPYAAYVPPGSEARVSAHSVAEVAICTSPGDPNSAEQLPPRLIEPASMKRSTRGKGANTRYVCDILPDTEAAYSLLVVEVRTPSGHSSSYPPHRHDRDNLPLESFLEESYYHRIDPEQGFVFQRVYTDERDLDQAMAVENGDVVLVPKGYHPVSVPYGYQSYYLNVMAGPKRVWKFHNDPQHEWLISL